MSDRGRRNAVYSLHSSIRGLHLNSQSAGRCLEFSSTSSQQHFSSPKPPDPKLPPLYQHKKMQHGTFLFTPACNPTPPPAHPAKHTDMHTRTYPWSPPFPPFVSVERHMVTAIRFPPAESAFHFTAVHKEVRLRQTEILCESSLFLCLS